MSHLIHLRTFLEVYRVSSLTKGAKRLGITQPAASAHIQALESLLGKSLFIRKAQGMEAMPAADELAASVSPYLDGLEGKLAEIQKHTISLAGTVYIATPADFLSVYIPKLVKPLLDNGLNLRFLTGNREQIYQNLQLGKADLAFTASLPDETHYDFLPLAVERLKLVMTPDLANRIDHKVEGIKCLRDIPLIAYSENLALIKDVFPETQHRQANITVADVRIIKNLVLAGQGWSVLPDYLCDEEIALNQLIELDIGNTVVENPFYLVWNKGALRQPRLLYVRDYFIEQAKLKSFKI